MSNNRTFFKKVQQGQMTLRDIFSDVTKKHTPEESAQVLIGGTALTTPREAEMLSNWQKPYMFARFLVGSLLVVALAYLMARIGYPLGNDLILVILSFMAPVTVLLLTWELNIPRNISLTEVLKWVALGGIVSLVFTAVFNVVLDIVASLGEFDTASASCAAVVEEPAKLAVVYMIIKKKDYKFVLNGVLVGMAVGTGFAIMETLNYILNYTRSAMMETTLLFIEENGLVDVELADILASLIYMEGGGYAEGLRVALVRALGSFSSHGTYAAIYGGGLMMVKGSRKLQPGFLFQWDHLKYFLVAVVLHACNNSTTVQYFMHTRLGSFSWPLVEALVMFSLFFLPLIRIGVNQIVSVTSAHNGGRVTMAVNRGAAPIQGGYAPPAPAAAFVLEGVAGPMIGRSFPIQSRITLGRGANCDISMPTASNVSGIHCVIQVAGGQVTVTDLGSTNGTFIGGRRLVPNQSVAVTSGTIIYLGNQNCGFAVR